MVCSISVELENVKEEHAIDPIVTNQRACAVLFCNGIGQAQRSDDTRHSGSDLEESNGITEWSRGCHESRSAGSECPSHLGFTVSAIPGSPARYLAPLVDPY